MKIKPEVYGTLQLAVSVEVLSHTEGSGLLEANSFVNDERPFRNCMVLFEDKSGKIISLKVHN